MWSARSSLTASAQARSTLSSSALSLAFGKRTEQSSLRAASFASLAPGLSGFLCASRQQSTFSSLNCTHRPPRSPSRAIHRHSRASAFALSAAFVSAPPSSSSWLHTPLRDSWGRAVQARGFASSSNKTDEKDNDNKPAKGPDEEKSDPTADSSESSSSISAESNSANGSSAVAGGNGESNSDEGGKEDPSNGAASASASGSDGDGEGGANDIIPIHAHLETEMLRYFRNLERPKELPVLATDGMPPIPGYGMRVRLMRTNPQAMLFEQLIREENIRKSLAKRKQRRSYVAASKEENSSNGSASNALATAKASSGGALARASRAEPSNSLMDHFGPMIGVFFLRTSENEEALNRLQAIHTAEGASSLPPSSASAPSSTTAFGLPSFFPGANTSLVNSKKQVFPFGTMCSVQIEKFEDNRYIDVLLVSHGRIQIADYDKEDATAEPKEAKTATPTAETTEAAPAAPASLPTAPVPATSTAVVPQVSSPLAAAVARYHPALRVKVIHHLEPFREQVEKTFSHEQMDKIRALTAHIQDGLNKIKNMVSRDPRQYPGRLYPVHSFPGYIADMAAVSLPLSNVEYYDVLRQINVLQRLKIVNEFVQREVRVVKLKLDIEKQMNERFQKQQEKHVLKEQMKVIQKRMQELGGAQRSDKEGTIAKFEERLASKQIPAEVKRVIDEEMAKLSGIDNDSMEFNITRNYLDWLTILPWGVHTKENYGIDDAERILNEDHYGLEDIKNRVLEFIAIGKMLGKMPQGKILCFVGPPGVGKCWARGTKLMMFDGSSKRVEDIVAGDQLMGDDSTPRTVQPGSLIHQNGGLYEIQWTEAGRDSWRCNAEHVLVLKCNAQPFPKLHRNKWHVAFYRTKPVKGTNDEFQVLCEDEVTKADGSVLSFSDRAAADQHIHSMNWKPLTFECRVLDYMAMPSDLRRVCQMFQPELVTFPQTGHSLAQRLGHYLHQQPTEEQVSHAAWLLGMWATNSIADVRNAQNQSAGPSADRIQSWYRMMAQGARVAEGRSAADPLQWLLDSYGMLHHRHLPQSLLTDSVSVRQWLLAGIIDGAGLVDRQSKAFELQSNDRELLDSFRHLARGLGFSTGKLDRKKSVSSAVDAEGWSVAVTGKDLASLGMISHDKRITWDETQGKAHSAERCADFTIESVGEGEYFGFTLDGNSRCLLSDFIITHNTSIGRSIARSLGRQFYRFSVGGMDDVAEVKGHRRTYVGAMPGKIIQCLKKTQCANPVILIDEIDKLGRGYRGDPAAALLEVLDPEQNNAFVDHYMDVPVDLSKVLFICTANTDDTIPGPLKDRMEIIHISGYVQQEKVEIARHYLVPAIRSKTGLTAQHIHIENDAIEELIRWYCREPGVRRLNQELEKVFRKAALKIAKTPGSPTFIITANTVSEYCGKRVFSSDRLYDVTPVGVSMGLAWNAMGGTTIFIEATIADSAFGLAVPIASAVEKEQKDGEGAQKKEKRKERGGFMGDMYVTGHLGDVMKESSMIAYTVAKHQLRRVDPPNAFFQNHRIHVHVPEGATPKDGPSAGITMVTALLSLALNRPVHSNIAMTGEISLTGKVMPIGGVKEKTMAAKRAGIGEMILPQDNRKDWDELPEFVRQGINPHFVANYAEVRKICFPGLQEVETAVIPQPPTPPPTKAGSAAAPIPATISSGSAAEEEEDEEQQEGRKQPITA